MQEHPGGYAIIHKERGTDVTVLFEDVGHSADARRCVQSFKIGTIAGTTADESKVNDQRQIAHAVAKEAKKYAFDQLSAGIAAFVFVITLVLWSLS